MFSTSLVKLATLAACWLVGALANISSDDVTQWTVEDVVEFARTEGLGKQMEDGITKHGIDGMVLLHLERSDLEDDLGIESSIMRKKIIRKVAQLRDNTVAKSGSDSLDRDFWQYRSMDRKRIDTTTTLLGGSPLVAILFVAREEDMGQGFTAEGSLKYVFPHYYIWKHSDEVMEGLPGLLSAGHLIAAIMDPIVVLYAIRLLLSGKQVEIGTAIGVLFFAPIVQWSLVGFLWLVYPIVPWVLCDISFYLGMIGILFQGVNVLVKMYNADLQDGKLF